LSQGYWQLKKPDLALSLSQQAAAGVEKSGFQHVHADRIVNNLIICHENLKHFDQAEPWRWKWLAVVKKQAGAESLAVANELTALGLNLLCQKKWTDAETVFRDSLAIREKKQPDNWTTFNAQSMLGAALLGQKKYAEAEPLLLKGYDGMKQRVAKIPPPF